LFPFHCFYLVNSVYITSFEKNVVNNIQRRTSHRRQELALLWLHGHSSTSCVALYVNVWTPIEKRNSGAILFVLLRPTIRQCVKRGLI